MKKLYSKHEEALADIKKENPRLIFLTGKTSSGKTFLSNKLAAMGYHIIALDKIIFESVMRAFNVVDSNVAFATYRGNAPCEWKDAFIEHTRAAIAAILQTGPVVVEGALANNEMIKAVFKDELQEFFFIFLQPTDVSVYTERILKRFKSEIESGKTGLPKEFFRIVDEAEVKNYLASKQITETLAEKAQQFAQWSLEESERRLKYFQSMFDEVAVVEV